MSFRHLQRRLLPNIFVWRDDGLLEPIPPPKLFFFAGISLVSRYLWNRSAARLKAGSDVNLAGHVDVQPAHQ